MKEFFLFSFFLSFSILASDSIEISQPLKTEESFVRATKDISLYPRTCPECCGRTIGYMQAPYIISEDSSTFMAMVWAPSFCVSGCLFGGLTSWACGGALFSVAGLCASPCLASFVGNCLYGYARERKKEEITEWADLAVKCSSKDPCAPTTCFNRCVGSINIDCDVFSGSCCDTLDRYTEPCCGKSAP
jgi:hypothetical protein